MSREYAFRRYGRGQNKCRCQGCFTKRCFRVEKTVAELEHVAEKYCNLCVGAEKKAHLAELELPSAGLQE